MNKLTHILTASRYTQIVKCFLQQPPSPSRLSAGRWRRSRKYRGIMWCTDLIVLAALGIVFGVALAIVAARFVVKTDPKVEKVRETLPGANCGACGFAGCMGYAEAVVGNPDVAVNLCAPGKSAVAEKIAEITGKKAEKVDPKIARVFCQGGNSLSQRKFIYTGVMDCTAAVLAAGGDKSCEYGCLGYATCMRACPFDAITMSADNLPIINKEKCTACGKCVAACPNR